MTEYGSIEVAPGVRISVEPPGLGVRVGFSSAKGVLGLLSALIRKLTGSPCSHTWLVYYDEDFKLDMVMEAHTEWRLVPFRVFQKHNNILAVFEPRSNLDLGLAEGGLLLGSRYDVEGGLGLLWVKFWNALRRRVKNPFKSKRMVFCSEGVVRIMQAAKYPGAEKLDAESVDPGELLKLLRADGSVELAIR